MEANAADRALIVYATEHGFTVSVRQLKRWRAYGVLPPRIRTHLGYRRGTEPADHPVARHQLLALCRRLDVDRRLTRAAFWLWYEGWRVPESLVRGQACDLLRGDHDAAQPDERRTSVERLADPLAVAHAATHRFPVSREEVRRLGELAEAGLDPAGERTTPTQLVHDVRTDLIASMLSSPGEITLHEDLVMHYLGASDITRVAAKAGINLADELVQGLATAAGSVATLQAAPDTAYVDARETLRRTWDGISFVRDNRDRLLAEISDPDFEVVARTFQSGPTAWDTRDADYKYISSLQALSVVVASATGTTHWNVTRLKAS